MNLHLKRDYIFPVFFCILFIFGCKDNATEEAQAPETQAPLPPPKLLLTEGRSARLRKESGSRRFNC